MNTWVQVDKLKDSESVNAKTLNRPVDQLASRTEYLKRRLGSILEDGVQSSIILTDVDLMQDDTTSVEEFQVGNIVYRSGTGFRKAQAKMHLCDDFTAAESAFTLGILINVNDQDNIGDVLIYGKLQLGVESLITKGSILQSGESFRPGRYYLSTNEAGKITAKPNGPLIYVGSFYASEIDSDHFSSDSVAYINPQFLDIGTSHVHRAYPLVARPAGNLIDGDVIGYLPIGAAESSYSPDSDSSSEERPAYPSLIFGGTWTSTNDVEYVFTLDSSNAWGTVKLKWYKDGHSESYKEVDIPAPGVFVNLDNGLKVKVNFPEATNSTAFDPDTLRSDETRRWELTFPYAGKGWVNHSVDAIASVVHPVLDKGSSDDGAITPALMVSMTGAWPNNANDVFCLFPGSIEVRTLSEATTRVTVGGTTYQFVQDGATPRSGNVAIVKAGTIAESLSNLAQVINATRQTVSVITDGDRIIVCDDTISCAASHVRNTASYVGVSEDGFNVVGGTIPAMVIYDRDYNLVGDIIINKPTYKPFKIGNLNVSVFANKATDTNNYTCLPSTVLHATAYDYSPEAVYDYVMGLHQEVDYYYPPVPAQAAGLFVNGAEVENAALFPDNPTVLIGKKTIHWMEDAYAFRPWPKDIKSHDEYVDPYLDKTMAFYFVVGFQCATGPVTSLTPAPGAPIKLYSYGTNENAVTGDLMIDAALDMAVVDAGAKGYNVPKRGKGGKLLAGPVVERIKAGNGIVISQASGCPSGQGTVTIGLEDGSMRGQFSEIALENAKQEKIGLFPYVSLLGWGDTSTNIPSAFTTNMRLPITLEDREYQLQLRMVMFGTVGYSGTSLRAAGIQLEYNILPDYTDATNASLKTGLLIPDQPKYRSISVPLGHLVGSEYVYTAYDPFIATTDVNMPKAEDVCVSLSDDPIPLKSEFSTVIPSLRPGYMAAIRLSRIATPDTQHYSQYTNPIGFLSMEWTLEEAQ